ncbi:unnamed protein product [Effrenium voratum]|nr:unnamed protein product [Effrenium voratum]
MAFVHQPELDRRAAPSSTDFLSTSYASSSPTSSSVPEDSSRSFERLEIQSTFSGSGRKIRREHLEVHHRTPKSRGGGCAKEEELKDRVAFRAGGVDVSLRVRDIPWLDDEDGSSASPVDLGKVQRLPAALEQEAEAQAAMRERERKAVPAIRLPEEVAAKNLGALSARGSSPSMRAEVEVQTARAARVQKGTPVTFYLEGRPEQLFGRVRCIECNGTYTVDVIGGGRKAGLDIVTPCSEADLQKAHISKSRPFQTKSDLPWRCLPRTQSSPELPSSEIEVGTPVAFFAQDKTVFGRIRSVQDNGVYVVDLAGGGIKVGVNTATPCSEEELDKVVQSKKALMYHLDAWSGYKTRNAPQRLAPSRPSARRSLVAPRKDRWTQRYPTLNGVVIAKERPLDK